MGRLAVLLLLSGCSRVFGLDNPVQIDASDIDVDATDGATTDGLPCYGHTGLCVQTEQLDRNLGAQTINTSAAANCDSIMGQPNSEVELCVLIGRTVIVSGAVKAAGTRPLVILATETLSITGMGQIDVASRTAGMGMMTGAGANPTSCVDGTNGTNTDNVNAGGGAGASFHGKGGDGGDSGATGGRSASGLTAAPAIVRGGCKGSYGGIATGALAYEGGDGGGAVFLVAGTRLEVTGVINASGGGGKGGAIGGNANSGGSGGGSGGLIWLDAPIVIVTGAVFANGGGGGGSSGGVVPGSTGGTSVDPATGGAGGSSPNGAGGIGAAGSTVDGAPGVSDAKGGGGGGGAAGFVQIYSQSPSLSQTISPPPILM